MSLDDFYQQSKPGSQTQSSYDTIEDYVRLNFEKFTPEERRIVNANLDSLQSTLQSSYNTFNLKSFFTQVEALKEIEDRERGHRVMDTTETSNEPDEEKKELPPSKVSSTYSYRKRRYKKPYVPPYPAQPQFGGVFKWKMSPQFYAETRLTDFTKPMPSGTMIGKYQSLMRRSFANCSRLFKNVSKDYLMVKAKMKYDWLKIMKIRKPMLRLAYRLFPRNKADDIKKKITSIIGGKVIQSKTRFKRGFRYRKKEDFIE